MSVLHTASFEVFLDQSCDLGTMSNFAKLGPEMTSRTRSYLTNQKVVETLNYLTIWRKVRNAANYAKKKKQLAISNVVGCG